MRYKILSANVLSNLETYVRLAIKDGWKPQGGVTASFNFDGNSIRVVGDSVYAQAMVKENDDIHDKG